MSASNSSVSVAFLTWGRPPPLSADERMAPAPSPQTPHSSSLFSILVADGGNGHNLGARGPISYAGIYDMHRIPAREVRISKDVSHDVVIVKQVLQLALSRSSEPPLPVQGADALLLLFCSGSFVVTCRSP
jgi:hypothetical protein